MVLSFDDIRRYTRLIQRIVPEIRAFFQKALTKPGQIEVPTIDR